MLRESVSIRTGTLKGKFPPQSKQKTTLETTLEKIVLLLRTKPTITRQGMANHLGLTLDGIRYHLKKLGAAGKIRHVGSTKSGSWNVSS